MSCFTHLFLGDETDEDKKVRFQRDDALLKKLDRIIIYLRIVHSVDFYNHGEYPNEDVMPNRWGIFDAFDRSAFFFSLSLKGNC